MARRTRPGIAARMAGVKISPIRRLAALLERAAEQREIISFGGGAPSLAPAKPVLGFLTAELRARPQPTSAYGSTQGMPAVLEAIAELLKREEGVDVNPATEITLSDGGTEGLFIAFTALLDPGDAVIIADPTYLGYFGQLRLAGAAAVPVPVRWERDFQFDIEAVKAAISRRTAALLLLSPDNPTGRVAEPAVVRTLVELAEDHGLWLITDDVYKDIIYDGRFVNSRRWGGRENTVSVCSFSKSASLPGFRLGYAYGPAAAIDRMITVKSYLSLCPSRPAQVCVEAFLADRAAVKRAYLAKTVLPTYKARRDAMAAAFKKWLPEAGVALPRGAFYFFPDLRPYLRDLGMDDEAFCDALLAEKKVVAIPGRYFGRAGAGHARFTFVSEPEARIREGFERIAQFIAGRA